MNKFIKFSYYNGVVVLFIWLIVLLYKINFWLSLIGAVILIFIFIYFTPKILRILNDTFWTQYSNQKIDKGFSLIEFLIVVAIIDILAAEVGSIYPS